MLRSLIAVVLTLVTVAAAEGASPIERYEALTSRRLAAADAGSVQLQRAVETLLSEPNDATLESARLAWRHAHNMFMMTQPLYLGEGGAGRDEVVVAFTRAEQILWGDDDKLDAPGDRPLSDFTSKEPEAARQLEQLTAAVTSIIRRPVRRSVQWAPEAPQAFLTHLAATATDLAKTHIEEPLASGDPQHEPSRYSDNALEDLRYTIEGMRQVVAALQPESGKRMTELLDGASDAARHIHAHMDYLIAAPADHPERQALERIAADLRAVAKEADSSSGLPTPGIIDPRS